MISKAALASFLLVLLPGCLFASTTRRIAIIGGGISGTSTAYYLKQLLKSDVQVDLYEPGELGGRLATARIDGKEYETGGTIIHSRNRHASFLVDKLGLTRYKDIDADDEFAGLISDNGFVLVCSKYSYLTYMKMFWRYGYDLVALSKKIKSMLNSFDRIYTLQTNKKSFTTVENLLRAADQNFVKLTQISTLDGFLAEGFSERTIQELIHATLRCNYGQSTSVPKFVGSVSLAPAFGGYCFSIVGGNKQLPERLHELSRANHMKEIVRQIIKSNNSKIIVSTGEAERTYDDVIISTPITQDEKRLHKFTFKDFEKEIKVPGQYHTTVCTLVRGILNNTFFGYRTPADVPNPIFSVSENLFYNSVSRVFPVDGSRGPSPLIWKVFSRDILTEDQLNDLFKDFTVESTTDWLAYPSYQSEKRNDSFVLDDSVYYTNAMEWAASAMETSLIGAHNVALLIYNSIRLNQKNYNNTSNIKMSHNDNDNNIDWEKSFKEEL